METASAQAPLVTLFAPAGILTRAVLREPSFSATAPRRIMAL
jgi:hypothetical protein